MIPTPVLLLSLAILPSIYRSEFRDDPTRHRLTIQQKGDDWLVSTTITINGTDHLVVADSILLGDRQTLTYVVLQNSDRLVRHRKEIEVEWRFSGERPKFVEYVVDGKVMQLPTEALKTLGAGCERLTMPELEAARAPGAGLQSNRIWPTGF